MQALTPKEWNNIPIPLEEAVTLIIKTLQALSKVSVHQESYIDDLTLVTDNVFSYCEASADEMRDRVAERVQMLN